LIYLLSEKNLPAFNAAATKDLPNGASLRYIDPSYSALAVIEKLLNRSLKNDLPAIAIITAKGEIVFVSSGYSIGKGEQLLKMLAQV
jgi:hypothetical protein